jgi:hypothetical protein
MKLLKALGMGLGTALAITLGFALLGWLSTYINTPTKFVAVVFISVVGAFTCVFYENS